MESAKREQNNAVTPSADGYERMLMLKPGEVRHLRDELAEDEYRAVVDLLFDWFLGRELPDGIEDNEVVFYTFSRISHRMEVSWVRAEAGRKGGLAGGTSKARFGNKNASKTQAKTQAKNAKQNGVEIAGNSSDNAADINLDNNGTQENNSKTQSKTQSKSPLDPPIIATSNNNTGYIRGTAIGGSKGGAPSAAPAPLPEDKELMSEQERLDRISRHHPTMDDVMIAARNTGVPAEYAEQFYRDMCETNWSYVNRYGSTTTVNRICLAAVLKGRFKAQKRFDEEDARRSGRKKIQPKGVKLSGDWDNFDFSRFDQIPS